MSLKDCSLLIKSVTHATENESREQKSGFFGMLLDILGASLLENMLSSKVVIRAGIEVIRVGRDF